MHEITELLKASHDGDTKAMDKLIPLVDQELKKIARAYLANDRKERLLQTTALVHEALIKLIKENIGLENRQHFYGLIARRMRQVLIDYARKEQGVERKRVEFVNIDGMDMQIEKSREVLKLEEALTDLANIDKRKATIVECRFFIGLTIPEVAELLGVAETTVQRDWSFARSWLKRHMTGA